jgi:(2Fe-2S) ferredoxin
VRELTLDSADAGVHQHEFFFCGAASLWTSARSPARRRLRTQAPKDAGISADQAVVMHANCFGLCDPLATGKATQVLVRPAKVVYTVTSEADIDEILEQHVKLRAKPSIVCASMNRSSAAASSISMATSPFSIVRRGSRCAIAV